MEYIDIEKDSIPYTFEIVLNDETFQFTINYNSVGDFFTVDLYRNSELVRLGEKLVYGQVLFENYSYLDIPKIIINPYDTTGRALRISYDNLNEDVFLYVK